MLKFVLIAYSAANIGSPDVPHLKVGVFHESSACETIAKTINEGPFVGELLACVKAVDGKWDASPLTNNELYQKLSDLGWDIPNRPEFSSKEELQGYRSLTIARIRAAQDADEAKAASKEAARQKKGSGVKISLSFCKSMSFEQLESMTIKERKGCLDLLAQ
jgi:hypothetical protein